MKQFRIRKDDTVMLIAGKDKDKVGKVLKVLRKHNSILVEKANMAKRHTKPNPHAQKVGGIIEKEMPVNISNVMLMCKACNKPTRVGYRYTDDGTKVRFCKKCNEIIK